VELIVATAGVAEDQLPPLTEEVRVEDPLEQIEVVPESVPAFDGFVTVPVTENVSVVAPVDAMLTLPETVPAVAVLAILI
jgi:hypothetical protein